MPKPETINVAAAAKILGCGYRSVVAMINNGKLPAKKRVDGVFKFNRSGFVFELKRADVLKCREDYKKRTSKKGWPRGKPRS